MVIWLVVKPRVHNIYMGRVSNLNAFTKHPDSSAFCENKGFALVNTNQQFSISSEGDDDLMKGELW